MQKGKAQLAKDQKNLSMIPRKISNPPIFMSKKLKELEFTMKSIDIS